MLHFDALFLAWNYCLMQLLNQDNFLLLGILLC